MIPAFTVIIIISISFLVTKVATIALMHTGLSRQSAKFQARSAFTGVGYATKESENIVNHPLRRRIIMLLMLLGNAGIVSVVATLMLTMIDSQDDPFNLPLSARVGLLVAGIALITIIFNSKMVNRWLSRVINFALQKYSNLNVKDYSGLLHLAGEYEISEIFIDKNDWLAEKRLAELALPREGLFILGINRKNGSYLGVPRHDTQIWPGDTLIIYGRASAIVSLSERKKGSQGDFERWLSEKENIKISTEENSQDQGVKAIENDRENTLPN